MTLRTISFVLCLGGCGSPESLPAAGQWIEPAELEAPPPDCGWRYVQNIVTPNRSCSVVRSTDAAHVWIRLNANPAVCSGTTNAGCHMRGCIGIGFLGAATVLQIWVALGSPDSAAAAVIVEPCAP